MQFVILSYCVIKYLKGFFYYSQKKKIKNKEIFFVSSIRFWRNHPLTPRMVILNVTLISNFVLFIFIISRVFGRGNDGCCRDEREKNDDAYKNNIRFDFFLNFKFLNSWNFLYVFYIK